MMCWRGRGRGGGDCGEGAWDDVLERARSRRGGCGEGAGDDVLERAVSRDICRERPWAGELPGDLERALEDDVLEVGRSPFRVAAALDVMNEEVTSCG